MKQVALPEAMLMNLFPFSGMAALIYQICWQRLLFNAFGVDIESITIIVSAFMLGLGVGALFGGLLADRFPTRILLMFLFAEATIGILGIFSPEIIDWAGERYVRAAPLEIAAVNFSLLLAPTCLMGATLPLLVTYLQRSVRHVGISVGGLYFANTLGASIGSFLVGFLLFHVLTIEQTIYLAACINFLIAAVVGINLRHGASA